MSRVLIIEDDPDLLRHLANLLQIEGYEPISAHTGQDGINLAVAQHPDVIICDIMMPVMDGFQVLRTLRDNPQTATIPFIFTTARSGKQDQRRGMEMGADDYVSKPFSRDELVAAINARVEKRQTQRHEVERQIEAVRKQILLAIPHELRTPLSTISGLADFLTTLTNEAPMQEVREIGVELQSAAHRLEHIIENHITFIQVELIAASADQRALLRDAYTADPDMQVLMDATTVALIYRREDDLRLDVRPSAPVGIAQHFFTNIIRELTDNAFKFSPPSTPVIVSGAVSNRRFIVRIEDRGRGMTPQQIAEIGAYQQFERQRHEQQGVGLGLIIAKRLIELHSGELSIVSHPGEGTTVTVALPINDTAISLMR